MLCVGYVLHNVDIKSDETHKWQLSLILFIFNLYTCGLQIAIGIHRHSQHGHIVLLVLLINIQLEVWGLFVEQPGEWQYFVVLKVWELLI